MSRFFEEVRYALRNFGANRSFVVAAGARWSEVFRFPNQADDSPVTAETDPR